MYAELLREPTFRKLVLLLLLVAPFEALSFFSMHLPLVVELPLFLFIILLVGRDTLAKGAKSLLQRRFSDINLLMTVAIIGALFLREFEEAAIIVILFSIGNYLERFGHQKSRSSLQNLLKSKPEVATVRVERSDSQVAIAQVRAGMVVVVKPGEMVPLDGSVLAGRSFVDESAITGESMPADKTVGDDVYGGTLNGDGFLEIRVSRAASDSTYAKILQLTEQALRDKSTAQQFIERFARYYTPAVMLLAMLLVAVPVLVLGLPFAVWLESALTLLVIACPCALVLSTPVAVFSAMGNASRKGMLIKGGRYVEELGRVKAVALDKTRTLTTGDFAITDIVPLNGVSEEELLACVAGSEEYSEHPLAKGIRRKAAEGGIPAHRFENVTFHKGKGLMGTCAVCFDTHHCVGNLEFIAEEHLVPEDVVKKIMGLEKAGKTVIVASDAKRVKGLIAFSDNIRPESKELVRFLAAEGLHTVVLSGDNQEAVKRVADLLGIDEYTGSLLPEEKVERVRALHERYRHVAMVGDGVNDTPALASASVGIAMGAAGSDTAIETADVVIMNDRLQLIADGIRLGRRTVRTVRSNIILAAVSKAAVLALALAGHANLALAIFADVGVTVAVVLNGLSLFGEEKSETRANTSDADDCGCCADGTKSAACAPHE
ncbi:cadmium-translocating P-type ATPase [Candidatus Woesearchaeota archaeon]|nr:cadmium-translocating P-type ATPase [Candidatus Woesearchaeota archaeon]